MNPQTLHIAIVTYRTDLALFTRVLQHLRPAVAHLETARGGVVRITVVDNGDDAATLRELLQRSRLDKISDVISSGSNLGYGKAHNLALARSNATYHVIMNPDVLVAEDALTTAINFLDSHADVAALSPHAVDGNGEAAFLCKRYPAVIDLALRGFAPLSLRRRFSARLDRYEHRALVARGEAADVDLISGCFMFCRTDALRKAGGFDPAFFLYFEDFSLSLELRKVGRVMYVPACRITHYGGHAGRKGLRHLLHFARSALTFYRNYGWKLL